MLHFKLLIVVFLILNFIMGCGIVKRVSNPNIQMTVELKLNRNIKIYAPEDSKVYLYRSKNIYDAYNVSKSSAQSNQYFEYQGKTREESKIIELKSSAEASRYLSSWAGFGELNMVEFHNKYWEEVWDYAAKEAEEHLVVKVINKNNIIFQQVYEDFWGFPYEIPRFEPGSASIVKTVDKIVNERDTYDIVDKYIIEYYDIIIEVE